MGEWWDEEFAAAVCDIKRVLITQIGFVQSVEQAPAVIAETTCFTHVCSIPSCTKSKSESSSGHNH
jgi:hypothetical protein